MNKFNILSIFSIILLILFYTSYYKNDTNTNKYITQLLPLDSMFVKKDYSGNVIQGISSFGKF